MSQQEDSIVTVNFEGSNYCIKYPKGQCWNYRVYRHSEDVTKMMSNNLVRDMLFEIQKLKGEE